MVSWYPEPGVDPPTAIINFSTTFYAIRKKVNYGEFFSERDLNNEVDRLTTTMTQQKRRLEELESQLLNVNKRSLIRKPIKSPDDKYHSHYEQGAGEHKKSSKCKSNSHHCTMAENCGQDPLICSHHDGTSLNTVCNYDILPPININFDRPNFTMDLYALIFKKDGDAIAFKGRIMS